jgi:hypothetical protein
LVLGRFCSGCDSVVDVRAKLEGWLAINQLVAILVDQAQRGSRPNSPTTTVWRRLAVLGGLHLIYKRAA